jgi:hypothetical protein
MFRFKRVETQATQGAKETVSDVIPLCEVQRKTGAEFISHGIVGLNLGRGKKNYKYVLVCNFVIF